MSQLFLNNASTELSQQLNAGATEMYVANANLYPLYSPDYMLVTIDDGDNIEIVKVLGRSGYVWYVERAQEGTSDRAWPSGVKVESRLTAGTLSAYLGQDIEKLDQSGSRGVDAINFTAKNYSSGYDPSYASGEGAIAIGAGAGAGGFHSVGIGFDALAIEDNALAIGNNARALGERSIALGANAITNVDNTIVLSGIVAMSSDNTAPEAQVDINTQIFNAGCVAVLASSTVDIGTPSSWQSGHWYHNGDITLPSSGGTVQYRLVAGTQEYCENTCIPSSLHDPHNSYSTEPTWGGVGSVVEIGSNHLWVGADLTSGVEVYTLPSWLTFIPVDVLFLCQELGVSHASAVISVGTAQNPSCIVNSETINVTNSNAAYKLSTQSPATVILPGESIQIKLNSTSITDKCLGRFILSGYFIETKVRA